MANVLFVCKQNAGRSQISEAFFGQLAPTRHRARSAGTTPGSVVHPVVVQAMREVGVDLSDRRPKGLSDDLANWADVIVTMGCGDACPFIPGKRYVDWDLTDPADLPLDQVRPIRDDIRRRVRDLISTLN